MLKLEEKPKCNVHLASTQYIMNHNIDEITVVYAFLKSENKNSVVNEHRHKIND